MKTLAMTAAALALAGASAAGAAEAAPTPPKLIVLISIDQFSADLFNSFRDRYRAGLRTLSHGIVYANGFHAQGVTETCAGHAVIGSGRHPRATGIIANQWFDQLGSINRYCSDDGVHVAARAERKLGVGPGLLQVATLGDWLKAATPASRVFTVAGKDRSAIMMGGHKADGAFWFDGKAGFDTWGTSAEDARRRLAPLEGLNARLATELARPAVRWTYADPACKAREGSYRTADGRTLRAALPPDPPAAMPGLPASSGLAPWRYDGITVDAALSLARSERLGRSDATDMLAVGLSGTDMVGHAYGSQGPEMCDQIARLDKTLARLLDGLTALRVPYVVAVTADHGGADIPERLAARGYAGAARLDPDAMLAALNGAVRQAAGIDWDALRPAFFDPTQLAVVDRDGKALADTALKARIAEAAAVAARAVPGITGAWTGAALAAHRVDPATPPDALSIVDRMALSYFPRRSGDVLLASDPLKVLFRALPGFFMMGHSGPNDVNRRVPILFWWPGAPYEERALPISVVDVAPTLAGLAGVAPTAPIDGHCIAVRDGGPQCPAQ